MPQVNLPIVVNNQASVGNAAVYIAMDIPRTITVDHPPVFTWTFSDANDHWHAFDSKGELPTLDAVRGPGSIEYYCKICAEQIFPATLPDPVQQQVFIRPPWATRVILAALPAGYPEVNRVTVRAQPAGQPINFGIAMVAEIEGTGPYQVDLIGEAPIAVMKP